ncbi:MAG: allophanate hydrolase, partial [Rhizobacter sp.]|nr:allophanate hydrolase [Rhizobacter sp.]
GQLTERGATLLCETQTAPLYRLYALPGTVPPKPGMVRVPPAEGASLTVEVWEMPVAAYGSFVALIPSPLGIGTLTLLDGSSVQGFVCETLALQGAEDITHHGGWRRYIASRQAALA